LLLFERRVCNVGSLLGSLCANFANACLANQEEIRNNTRHKQKPSKERYGTIHSKLAKVMASLLFAIFPLLSFYYIKTGLDSPDGFGRRFSPGIIFLVRAHLFGLYVLFPVLGLNDHSPLRSGPEHSDSRPWQKILRRSYSRVKDGFWVLIVPL